MNSFFLAPIGFNTGLTSVALGLLRALQQADLAVNFIKPIAQDIETSDQELSTHFARLLCHTHSPTPLSMKYVERLLGQGQVDLLMEEIVSLYQTARSGVDVLVIEGLAPTQKHVFSTFLNTKIARNLAAHTILVASAEQPQTVSQQFDMNMHAYGRASNLAGLILNRVRNRVSAHSLYDVLQKASTHPAKGQIPLIGAIPENTELTAPRTLDVANYLHATVLNAGQINTRRVHSIVVTARSAPNMVQLLKPGALIITSGDREDIVLATAIATMNNVALAGLLLTCDSQLDWRIKQLCEPAFNGDLPVMSLAHNTFETSSILARMQQTVPADDSERMEQVIDYIAEHLDSTPLKAYVGQPRIMSMTPPAFRYRLREKARAANKRIVLPEGEEARTIKAAALCHEKEMARCVLLGNPQAIARIAHSQGITLPATLEIVDPSLIRMRYVEPMVALRKHKGLKPPMAEEQLEDNVVLGTMMLALDEVDGLVSGAIHTTANTIRPALQLIKTAPGARLVSSVFFMLMPEQVLVYGDCAVNPDPTAEELADIAIQSADSAQAFGIQARVAMISYSTGASGTGVDVEKVRTATTLVRQKRPDLIIDGPLQYDAASVESIGRQKAPHSLVAGRATVFIFPDLNTGNTTYKAVQRSANVVSVGPMLQGLRKPVNDLSRGALVDDIVYTLALTAIQAARGESSKHHP